MNLNRLIRKLLPGDDKFFRLLEESAQNLVEAGTLMVQIAGTKKRRDRDQLVMRVQDHEHRGDAITHRIFSELNATFVTPLDREDIHSLASSLDDVMDHMNGSAARLSIYDLKVMPPPMAELTRVLMGSMEELLRGVQYLRDLHHPDPLKQVLTKVNEYENEADAIFEEAIAKLFKKEKDPIQLIKVKEVYVALELATDKCEDAANVMESILIKHA
jgi:uncharacterized protein